ncbi:DUF2935 domain-containing protein [Desulfofalx alkaliphila]|uniref:DUF2935 domain-containing protein n=1 Tax=Desulfofalx alkaliphila TaxID=105483 RepID=UPI000551A8D4|nr:DUF2935 domain-containing protein [Desulfofalx alkaliphila]
MCKNEKEFANESLRQNLFWLRIMAEHALFVRLGLPCNETQLINEAIELEAQFRMLLKTARETPKDEKAVRRLNSMVIKALDRIISFKTRVLKRIITCSIGGANYPLLVDHIRREAIRFRAILIRLNKGIKLPLNEKVLQEEIFWLRIMGDHARFIAHLLDPSERELVGVSFKFAERFETLRLQARDLESMLVPGVFEEEQFPVKFVEEPLLTHFPVKPGVIPRLIRFNKQVINATKDIRDFKKIARELIAACKVLSIIDPLLADHVLREANMALEDLTMIQNKIDIKC